MIQALLRDSENHIQQKMNLYFISLVIYFSLKNTNLITINQVLFSIEVVKEDHVYNVPRKSFELYLQHDFLVTFELDT